MSLAQKIAKLSFKAKNRWVLALIIIFVLTAALITGGNYYNKFAYFLEDKTNELVILPKMPELPFNLGLDLQGGTQLVYEADVENIALADRGDAMESVRDVIERRVNAFGVSEPIIQVNRGANNEYRIIAELAGVKDVEEAIKMIGETPILEFKEQDFTALEAANNTLEADTSIDANIIPITNETNTATPIEIVLDENNLQEGLAEIDLGQTNANSPLAREADIWKNTELTGKYLKRAVLQFNPNDGTPEVSLEFNDEGAKLFEDITARNVGHPVAIFLDGYVISAPTVNEKIVGGKAVISGQFNVEEARLLVKRLNSGALPVPISLVSQKTVEASLGSQSIDSSLKAGFIGLLLVSIFMIIVFRLPGLISVISLTAYGLIMLAIFKVVPVGVALPFIFLMIALIFYVFNDLKIFDSSLALLFILIGILLFFYTVKPITLSLSGIAGLILSLGMAVDANILIFARMKEELKLGKTVSQSLTDGFKRAWPSIRDGNITVLLTCLILMFFGTSSVKGFGTTLFIGVSVSLFSAIVITRTLLVLILGEWSEKKRWLLGVKNSAVNSTVNK
ncbi:MAG: preprotein translocase subunit SecD [Patescibacteria group bacterium]|jgi:protein-export membrane protein SecD|nr:protein translocase subunit SecD [bacterium]HQC50091.1 protein translocase subunit SecD [bacterium]